MMHASHDWIAKHSSYMAEKCNNKIETKSNNYWYKLHLCRCRNNKYNNNEKVMILKVRKPK